MENPIISTIKIGRKKHIVKKGDYVLYNGFSYRFISEDMRILEEKRFDKHFSLQIPKSVLKMIPFDKMKKESSKSDYYKNIRIKYFF